MSVRFMDAYRMGLSVKQAMFAEQAMLAVRKYKSHRRLPGNVLEEVERMIAHASEKRPRQACKIAESKHRARAERKATKQAKMAIVIAE